MHGSVLKTFSEILERCAYEYTYHRSQSLTTQVLLLHPGEGSPGFAEVPHMGSALTGSSPGWSEAAEQLVKRVQWDLGDEAVEFRHLERWQG